MEKEKFVIQGKQKLKGEIEVGGAKNATFSILAATLLTKEDVFIDNLPLIEDILRMIEILEGMGAEVEWLSRRKVRINTKNVDPNNIDKKKILKFRGSVLLFGPLLARFQKVSLPKPGGCVIGVRPIDTHLEAFSDLDMKITEEENLIRIETDGKTKRKTIILNEISVTTTENVLLFAALNEGTIIVKMADMDYPSMELVKVLKKMGVSIEVGFHQIKITGKKELSSFDHKMMYDPIEAGTYIILAAVTKGDILVKNVDLRYLYFPLKILKNAGMTVKIYKQDNDVNSIRIAPWEKIKIEKIQSLPFPGLPSDLLPLFGVLASQAKGATIIHDPLYDGRLEYLKGLRKMGVDIFFSDPHRAIVSGPSELYGADLGSFDLRAGASLITAALIAKGKTTIREIYQVDRGYEQIDKKLKKLGADIKRVKYE
ncbi:MAG: UDP-N-acetylglucosamine 1-carboxyvinyltransferase [Candidatus Pacebacteria bacterium]|nr:UDP-N-acetylglucosamine 1-carboxyvinyltransferase [Candidatus Paceibacterota bacterium]